MRRDPGSIRSFHSDDFSALVEGLVVARIAWTKERVRQVETRTCDKLRQIAAARKPDLLAS
ncbi:MAG: hypothetical protein ACHRXM_32245 [Isosphaerales bacterium]